MIALTRLDGKGFVVNADHIVSVEATPDTVIHLFSGQYFMVAEPVTEVVDRVAAWQRRIRSGPVVVREGNVLTLPVGGKAPE